MDEFYIAVDLKEVPKERRIKNPKTKTHDPMYTDLEKYIRHDIPLVQRFEIGSQVLAGLNYLHQAGFVQGDPKPENMLVFNIESENEDMVVRISDFGKAIEIDPKNTPYIKGNPRFSPP